jgi:pimeloyl-ACP methyl ester carboxylesterase
LLFPALGISLVAAIGGEESGTGAAPASGEWLQSPWYGWVHGAQSGTGWRYHLRQGWVWMHEFPGESLWMWNPALGWNWASQHSYPRFYQAESRNWLELGEADGEYRLLEASGPAGSPVVVASEPYHGEAGVAPGLDKVRVSFDRPMSGTASWEVDPQWGGAFALWSPDRRSVELCRFTAGEDLPALTSLRFILNPNGRGFADPRGNALPRQVIAFTTGIAAGPGAHVTGSYPASNETGVDPLLDTVEIHFSEPMMPTGGFQSSGWWPWTLSWSADNRTAYVQRGNAGTPIYAQDVTLRTLSFRTASGQLLDPDFIVKFLTAPAPAERVAADPAKGFYWPYYLLVPPAVEAPGTLLVEPNNTGGWSDDPWVHEEAALTLLNRRAAFAIELGCPLLVPVFPRPQNPPAPEPGGIYVHALDRFSIGGNWQGLQRVDLQMAAMIEDALARLRAAGHTVDDGVFMMGFSASGAFTSRFAALHPQRLKAAAAGSSGGWPTVPVAEWNEVVLKYPMGIADIESFTGEPFRLESFKRLPLFIYVGGQDTNDAFDVRGTSAAEKSAVYQFLNYPADPFIANRWPLAQTIFDSVGASAQLIVYPGVAHTITSEMFADIMQFFREQR